MTLAELVLNRMQHGAKLIVVGDVQQDANGTVNWNKIGKLLIVTSSEAEIPLPTSLFIDICPSLSEAKQVGTYRFEYTLRMQ